MADKNLALQLIIRAKDEATSLFSKVFTALNDTTNVIAGKVRDAFTGIFGGALSGAMEFEAQLSKVQAKGQFTAATMGELRQVAIDVGAKFGISGTEAAQGMESLAAAGLNAQQIMQTLPSVLALARIEGLSMDAASEKLANSLTAVGLEFDQAGRMADVLAQGAIASTTSASALAEALSTSGQIANSSGLIFEKTAAVLTALAKGGSKVKKRALRSLRSSPNCKTPPVPPASPWTSWGSAVATCSPSSGNWRPRARRRIPRFWRSAKPLVRACAR